LGVFENRVLGEITVLRDLEEEHNREASNPIFTK
jgi:hypothetical protein